MKLNIKLDIYLEKIKKEFWLYGYDILDYNAADKIIEYWS